MKNRKFIIWTLSLFLTLILLYILVFFAFYFQQSLSIDLKFLFSISILFLFTLFVLSTILAIIKLNISTVKKIIFIFSFVTISTTILYSLSSIKRESEIKDYFANNKNNIESLINYYQKNGEDSKFSAMLKEMNIPYFRYTNDEYHIGLYSFTSYGYRLMYSEKTNLKPHSPGGSPTQNWFKINNRWYYYSYFD